MRKHLIQFLLVAVLSVFSAAAFAQTTVRGQLVDSETGEPLVGAAVMVEGTTQGSVTDIDGYFKQSVASNATLLFKYVVIKTRRRRLRRRALLWIWVLSNGTGCCDAEGRSDYIVYCCGTQDSGCSIYCRPRILLKIR